MDVCLHRLVRLDTRRFKGETHNRLAKVNISKTLNYKCIFKVFTDLPHFRQFQRITSGAMRTLFAAGTFHHVKLTGERASPKQAPIMVVAPHSSYVDSIIVVTTGPPSIVAKRETSDIPLLGSKYISPLKCVVFFLTKYIYIYTNLYIPKKSLISPNPFMCNARIPILDRIRYVRL